MRKLISRLSVPLRGGLQSRRCHSSYRVEAFEPRVLLSVISGIVFEDSNFNGIRDAGEPGIAGRTVFLDVNGNGVLDPDRTSSWNGPGLPHSVDGHPSGFDTAISQITPTGLTGLVKDANVTVDISHPVSSDLTIGIATDFAVVQLANREGVGTRRDGPNYSNTTFDDQAATPIGGSSAPHIGSFQPEDPLALLNGTPPSTLFEIQVIDQTLLDDGTVNSATLRLVTGEPTEVTESDGSFAFVLPSLQPGTYDVRQLVPAGSAATKPAGNQAVHVNVPSQTATVTGVALGTTTLKAITGFAFEDLNGNGTRDTGDTPITNSNIFLDLNKDGVRQTYGSTTFVSTDVPKSLSGVGAFESSLNLGGKVSGLVTDVNVTLDMTLDDERPVSAFLVSPSGRRVELFSHIGVAGQEFTKTTFDDQSKTPIGSGTPPFTGSFHPVGQLSDFANENPSGVWNLEISDTSTASKLGQLTGWSLRVTTAEPLATYSPTGNYIFDKLFPGAYQIGQEVPAGYLRIVPQSGVQPVEFLPTGGFTAIPTSRSSGPRASAAGCSPITTSMARLTRATRACPTRTLPWIRTTTWPWPCRRSPPDRTASTCQSPTTIRAPPPS